MSIFLDKKPKYRDLKFKSDKSFNEWLSGHTYRKILFEDRGQDLLSIWVDNEGEILHTNLQTSVWCGRFVKIENGMTGKPLKMLFEGKWKEMYFIIEEVIA